MPTLDDVHTLNRGSSVRVIPKFNAAGAIRSYQVFRVMPERWVYLGERVTVETLFYFCRRLRDHGVSASANTMLESSTACAA